MLLEFLKDQRFDHRYVVRDDVSKSIAEQLYPYLYQVENALRGYLTKFMAIKIGPSWWTLNASADMSDKAKERKGNERVFGKLVNNSAFLIDFDDLGELVYEQSSGFLTKEDVANRVLNLEESIEALKSLKEELRSNYQKYFQEHFAKKDFKNKVAYLDVPPQQDCTQQSFY